jgi:uncharacterized protein (TIGR02271 family)
MNASTRTRNVVAVFDNYSDAQHAVEQLTAAGFQRDDIDLESARSYAGDAARGNVALSGEPAPDHSGGGITGFLRRLFGSDIGEHDREAFTEAVRRGGAVVCVTTDEQHEDRAADILNENGAVDIDNRSASPSERREIRGESREPGVAHDRSIPVVDEELRVGKRVVQRGGVRVYNRVQDQPVEQQVELREEHVYVERRDADRPATDADLRNQDEVIEVKEMAEEPVVEKRSRVVEEVVVGKDENTRTETIRDTVRKSDVDVERFGAESSPAYDYGRRMSLDERYRGRNWEEVEPDLRIRYERTYPDSKWDQIKDAVRRGWDKVTGERSDRR